ncbi:leucine--tRNA ligase [Candidatus Woesearchaeota archaeon]|nr:leucine--tRNA ligase [Candidatus Woesearchaeota archaeon]
MMDFEKITQKWQKRWKEENLGDAEVNKKPKFFIIFAYPGISGYMHVGHMRGFSYTDAFARYKRMKGYNVLFPVGTHASGNQAIAFAKKIKNKDEKWIEHLKENGCPEDKISELGETKNIVEFFNKTYVDTWKKFGFLADWERFTSTIYDDYQKFIQWQFLKLKQNNLLIQKPYYATFCPSCGPVAVDPSETDISKGGNAERNEYTLLKFKFNDSYLVAATLRPETIFGQTNLWVNPEATYVKVQANKENWIMSEQAAQKLSYQKENIKLGEKVNSKELLGKKAIAPGINREIIILPSKFADANLATGIVTSVPSDAPYDYIALKDLQNNKDECQKYGLNYEEIRQIKLIPIIKSKGYGEFPAKEICEKLGIKNQDDPKLEEATKEIYKAGFHTGVMRENSAEFSGKSVAEAKELMKQKLTQQAKADVFYDLSEEVICRCGTKVVIKKIDDQWFIKYSDKELTEKSKHWVQHMNIYPEEYKTNLPAILDWFQDRACARLGNWIGTKLSFDQKWIIEPISDSTLYPAYYLISKYVNNEKIKKEELTEEFFDYVFLNKGAPKNKTWEKIKQDVDYWYPLDINLGGKEHRTVHFPVFLMNHVGVLEQKQWPKGIFVNWWVTGKGGKISKSKGGAEPIQRLLKKFSVDAVRLYYAHVGSPHSDVEWDEEVAQKYKNGLERIHAIFCEAKNLKEEKKPIDAWLTNVVNQKINQASESLENYDLRTFANTVYFSIIEDFKWYLRRLGNNKKVFEDWLSLWCKTLTPITPHLAEELWEMLENKKLVSTEKWPEIKENKLDLKSAAQEELINNTVEGMNNVIKLAKIEKPKKATLFVSEDWKYELFSLLSKELQVTRNVGEIMKKVMQNEKIRKQKNAAETTQKLIKDPRKITQIILDRKSELKILREAQKFFQKEFNFEFVVSEETNDKANPGRPAIVLV